MLRLNLFKLPKHKKFEYAPRYYDADKEELRARVTRLNFRDEGKSLEDFDVREAIRSRISSGLRSSRLDKKISVKANTNATLIRLSLVIVMTVAVLRYLPFILNAFLE